MPHFYLNRVVPSGLAWRRLVAGTKSREAGLTLVELLIALALLGFVMLGIAPLFIASVKSNYSANEYTSVNVLARDKLEELENMSLNSGDLSEGLHPNDLPAFLPDPLTGLASTIPNPYTRTWTVTDYKLPDTLTVGNNSPFIPTPAPGPAVYDYKQIDVTVVTAEGHLGIGSRRAMITGYVQNPNFLTPPPAPTPTP